MVGEIEVIFGSVSSLVCRGCSITSKINSSTTATLRFERRDFLQLGAINYLDEVVINSISQKRLLYRGNIVSIKSEPNNQVVILLDNGTELTETGVKSLTVIGVDHREVVYSLARQAGFLQNHINIPGLDNSVKEMIAFVPFKGLLIEEEEMVGDAQLISLKKIQEKFANTEKSEAWNGFFDADGWVSFRFKASHFADAEDVAIEKAEVFLSAYSGSLQYSYSQFGGDFIEWERINGTINLKRQNHILLIMLPTSA